MSNISLGEFCIDVELQENGKYDIWLSHSGSSGEHHTDVTITEIGEYVADLVECIAEGYQQEF